MANLKKQIPDGTLDFLPEECAVKRDLENKIRGEFIKNGYMEVQTPTFEYYDVFSQGVGSYVQEHMMKLFDLKGHILVLRPDLTVPIARLAATKMDIKGAKRLCYVQNAYSISQYSMGQRSEYTQAGVEYIGRGGSEADAETIALAIRSLIKTGLKNFTLEIGQVAFFKGLMQGFDAQIVEQVRMLINAKNSVELEYLLDKLNVRGELRQILLQLPALFGNREVIEKAQALSQNEVCKSALDNLCDVYDILCDFGLEQYICLDLGMLNNLDYYSGVVFRGMADGIGFPVLSGGRYDNLFSDFGCDKPAIGFAMGIKRILIALESQEALRYEQSPAVLIISQSKARKKAYEYAEKLRKEYSVIFEMNIDERQAREYAQQENIEKILLFKENGEMEEIG